MASSSQRTNLSKSVGGRAVLKEKHVRKAVKDEATREGNGWKRDWGLG